MRKYLALTTLMLSACGFQPMYGTPRTTTDAGQDSLQRRLTHIEIGNIPDRSGQFLRNALIDRFYHSGMSPHMRYRLTVQPIQENIRDLDITIRSDTTRRQLSLQTSIILEEKETGQVVLNRPLRSIGSFNVLSSEFATRVSEQSTRDNALHDLARQIESNIALYFDREDVQDSSGE